MSGSPFPPSLTGEAFLTSEVVDHYTHRPPYAAGVFDRIVAEAPATRRLLDLGCGEGKLARPLSEAFDQVVAVDPSENMIALGRRLHNGQAPNITWLASTAEEAALEGRFDVVTFASSIHWMEPNALFEKLKRHVEADHILAFVSGDVASDPPWEADWRQFLAKWVPIATGRPYGAQAWSALRDRHLDHVTVVRSEALLSDPVRQRVEDYVTCQHARDTFAIPRLGDRLSEFRQELQDLLMPHADGAGVLTFQVSSDLTLATLPA